ncbi:MAG: hypothetical protein N2Z76_10085 [Treponemataceae bacterium]|nr:hypothetical protein [Treponemataceae bacterium]
MVVFTILWIPLFFFFYRSLFEGSPPFQKRGPLLALWGGSLESVLKLLMGVFVDPHGGSVGLYFHGLLDVLVLPLFVGGAVFCVCRRVSSNPWVSPASFTLLWMVPVSLQRALLWSGKGDPVYLVGVPLLWTILIVGFWFLFDVVKEEIGIPYYLAWIGMVVLPFGTSFVFWAWYEQHFWLGMLLFLVFAIPAVIHLVQLWKHPLQDQAT